MTNPAVNMWSSFANYKSGFPRGFALRGLPLAITQRFTGKLWFVDSSIGANNTAFSGRNCATGDFNRPFATIAFALSAAVANNGDMILVAPNHTETITAAGGWTFSNAGVMVIGYAAENGDRPTVTLSTATTASVLMSAANCSIHNIIFTPAVASLANPINVQAADNTVDIEWRDDTAGSFTPVNVVVGNASAARLNVNIAYRGKITSNNLTSPVKLTGVNVARINLDFYGYASTSMVNFVTTACTDVHVGGRVNNLANTALTAATVIPTVVDTITGSTWTQDTFDAQVGTALQGGSNRYPISGLVEGFNYYKVTATFSSATWNTVAFHAIGATTGIVECYITPIVTGALTSGGSATLALGDTTTAASVIAASAYAGFTPAGMLWSATTPVSAYSGANFMGVAHALVSAPNNIGYTVGTAALTGGTMDFHVYWRAISATGKMVPGAGGAS